MASKAHTVIEHRWARRPSISLADPRVTEHKMRAEGHCRMCLRPASVRPLTRHHLVPEAWFLRQPLAMRLIRNAHANIVPLCRPCHDLVDNRSNLVREEARMHLRRSFSQSEIAFAIQVRGQHWLDREYPRI